jgi:nucleotide-binding universal stress UspA family protein
MFKRILVPIDGSKPSGAGLRAAIALAREQKARIRLVHLAQIVLAPPPMAGFAVSELYALLKQTGAKLLRRAAQECARRKVPCETRLYVAPADRASDVIVREARKFHADLIVMGTHGRRGVRRFAMGSDAEQVLRTSSAPVMVVRSS